jgi:O-succinylbenzoic acid--CoA ligase
LAAVTVPDWLRQRADVTPARIALIGPSSETLTFADLDARVDAAAALLGSGFGVVPGQHVGLLAPNGLGFAVAVHALMRTGAVIVPLNTRLTAAELDWQRADAELRLTLDAAAVAQLLDSAHASLVPALELSPADGGAARWRVSRAFDLEAPHSVIYTSGTTGRPKGAILTYGNFWWSAIASALNLGVHADDRWLACLPLFHVGGLSILLRSVIYGTAAVIHERFDPARANLAIDREGITIISVVSTMLERMLADRAGRPFPSTLRCVLLGGGPAPLPLLQRALELRAPVVQTYGLTEAASQVATLAPEDAQRKVGSAGKPLMGTELRIAIDGEILVHGPTVSPGYLHQPPRPDDWLHTGDLGYLDGDGYLYVLDRRDDLIVSGGENVYPAEVEAVLLAHPDVIEAGVRGLPHAEWGQIVGAAVVLRPGATPTAEALQAFVRQHLAGYKVPRRITFVDALPRNASGKLLRRELRLT